MDAPRLENLPPPPGIINSIKAGFDSIASHITTIFLPLLLNMFMWLGPRLQMNTMFNALKNEWVTLWRDSGISSQDVQSLLDLYNSTIPNINLFWMLRTLPIGISSLLLPKDASATPLGDPSIWQVSVFSLPLWMMVLTFVGWVGGGIYYRFVAWAVVPNDDTQGIRIPRAIFQTVLISFVSGLLFVVIGFPVMMVFYFVAQLSTVIANILLLVLSFMSMWVIVPLFFWPHGVFVRRQNMFTSLISSIQLTRFTLPTSSMFVLTVFLLSFGLNYLWRIPPMDSWMTLIGIFGHSFVTTALLAASFIYYRDMSAWLGKVIEKLRPVQNVKQAE